MSLLILDIQISFFFVKLSCLLAGSGKNKGRYLSEIEDAESCEKSQSI